MDAWIALAELSSRRRLCTASRPLRPRATDWIRLAAASMSGQSAVGTPYTNVVLKDARSVQAFRAQLQRKADRLGAIMKGYDHLEGRWDIEVPHF